MFVKTGVVSETTFQGSGSGGLPGTDFLVGQYQPFFQNKLVNGDIHLPFEGMAQGGLGDVTGLGDGLVGQVIT